MLKHMRVIEEGGKRGIRIVVASGNLKDLHAI